jgi:carbamoyltransferase
MNVIGLSAFYHESSCCLLQDGRLVAAALEERFSRVKHDPRLPISSFRFCLEAGQLSIADVDCVAYYELPKRKLARQLWMGNPEGGGTHLPWVDARQPEREIREVLGFDGPIKFFEHHRSHAASSFCYSGFPEAAILTVDGVGEWATTTYGAGRDGSIDLFEEVEFPHSIGLLYSTFTSYLGFEVNDGEYKVMGLAPYGEPRYVDKVWTMLQRGEGGQYSLDMRYFDYLVRDRMYSDEFCELMGAPPRKRETKLEQFHKDAARSLQVVLEEILLEKLRYLHSRVPSENLCMAGGVALNCVANSRILRDGPFRRLFVQPAAGDAGGCLGAAALAHQELTGHPSAVEPLRHVYLGPRYDPDAIARLLGAIGLRSLDFRGREAELLEAVVDRLVQQKVVGWFHGAMEFGPRALGARSILADPRDPTIRERLNRFVKKRESFRPFAPSVLLEHTPQHFELDHPAPYMLETCQVRSSLSLPAITHVDGSARPQTVDRAVSPRYAALIDCFRSRTGVPLLVNTSFNVRGEPIVCSPVDAIFCMANSEIQVLVLEDFLIDREWLEPHWTPMFEEWNKNVAQAVAVSDMIYTFR